MNTVTLIARREYVERLKQRGFIIGTVLGVLTIVALSFLSVIFGFLGAVFSSPTSIAVLAPDVVSRQAIQHALAPKGSSDYALTVLGDRNTGRSLPAKLAAQLKAKKYDAALVAYRRPDGQLAFTYYPHKSSALDEADSIKRLLQRAVLESDSNVAAARQLEKRLSFGFSVQSLNERYRSAADEFSAQAIVYFLLVLMYMAVILYGVQVAQGVIEEKANRVMEIMIGAVRPAQLLAGKILGIGSLALSQFVLFGIVGLVMIVVSAYVSAQIAGPHLASAAATAAASSGQQGMPGLNIATVPATTWLYLIVFFVLGFFTYATLSSGVGALASRAEDVQSSSAIYTLPMVAAYLLAFVALSDPEKPLAVWASMIPLLSPMVMFTRVATSTVPIWQIGTAIGLSLIVIWLLTMVAAKLYRVGVLMYGKPPKLKDIWKALRSPA